MSACRKRDFKGNIILSREDLNIPDKICKV